MSGFEIILGGLSAISGLAGTAMSVAGTLSAAEHDKNQFEYEKKVREQQADEAEAASQRAAAGRYREGRIIQSRQRAVAAATSGDTTDQSVISIMGQTAAETDLAARTEIFKGKQQAKGFNDAATVAQINADNAMTSGVFNAIGAGVGGVTSMFDRFGKMSRRSSQQKTAPLYMLPR